MVGKIGQSAVDAGPRSAPRPRVTERREIDRTNGSNVLVTTYAHDSRGHLLFTVNAEGNPTRYTYDGVGRMTKKEVALGFGSPITTFTSAIVTEWGFDQNNRLTSFKDDAANTSTWTYDAKDRVSTMVYPNTSQVVTYVYDAVDNVVELEDPSGNLIEDTYDSLNRNTLREVTLQSGWLDTTEETRTNDALNRLLVNEGDDYRVTYTYGVLGLSSTVYQETQEFVGGTAYAKTVTTKYDAAGNRVSETYPSALALTYAYNDIYALASVTDGTDLIASFTYVGLRPKVTTFGNGSTATYTWGGFRPQLTGIHHQTSGSATLVRMDYGHNQVHDRTYERFGGSGSPGDAFEYDKARRLTKAWMGSDTPSSPSGNPYVQTIAYNMDDDGNRTSVVTTPYGQSPTSESYATNNLNQYTVVGGVNQSHDASGNLTNNGTYTFKYNYKNLICEVRTSGGGTLVATYQYDANGRRVGKAVNGGITERYIYSGVETVSVYDGSNGWKQDFVFDPTSIDRILALEQADVLDEDNDTNTSELTRSYYHTNALGSVMMISTASEDEAASYRYTPYGERTITVGGTPQGSDPLGQSWGYTGRFHDMESGLTYYRARSVTVRYGKFDQRDPLGVLSGANLYTYAESRPGVLRDPSGLSASPWVYRLMKQAEFCSDLLARIRSSEDWWAVATHAAADAQADYDRVYDRVVLNQSLLQREAQRALSERGPEAYDQFWADAQPVIDEMGSELRKAKDDFAAATSREESRRAVLSALKARYEAKCARLGVALSTAWVSAATRILDDNLDREKREPCGGEGLRPKPLRPQPPAPPADPFRPPPLPSRR